MTRVYEVSGHVYQIRLTHKDGRIEWRNVQADTPASARTKAKQDSGACRANVFAQVVA